MKKDLGEMQNKSLLPGGQLSTEACCPRRLRNHLDRAHSSRLKRQRRWPLVLYMHVILIRMYSTSLLRDQDWVVHGPKCKMLSAGTGADYYTHISHNHQIWWGSAVLLSSKGNRGVHSDSSPSKTVTLTGNPLVYTR